MVTKRASDKAINSDNFVDVDNDDVDNDKSVNEKGRMTVMTGVHPILADKCDSQVRNAGEGDSVNVLDNASKQNPVH